jgi:hypothetical protein
VLKIGERQKLRDIYAMDGNVDPGKIVFGID